MAGENETTTETPEVVEQTTEIAQSAKPHPLEPGGERWNEIYRERSDYKREAERLREENARLRQPAQAQQSTVYTQDQLQALVDAGRITPAQMAGQLALQAKELAKVEMRQEFQQQQSHSAALTEVESFIERIPALRNTGSEEFSRVSQAAYEIAAETGWVDAHGRPDPRAQRRALRETFGTLDRVAKVGEQREFARRHADTYTESGRGGGTTPPKDDPLKDIPKAQIDYWTRRGYSRDQMLEEAKYYRPKRRPL